MLQIKDINALRDQVIVCEAQYMAVDVDIINDILDLWEAARYASATYEFPVADGPETDCDFYMGKLRDLVW